MNTEDSLHEATHQMLVRERSAVTARLHAIEQDNQAFELDSDWVPPSGYARENAMSVMLERRLSEIEGALARIGDGTYGTCESCGKEIPPRRLEALPFATLCVTCQSVADKRLPAGRVGVRGR